MDHYSGTYVNGVVMPDSPLPIADQTRVEFILQPAVVEEPTPEQRRAALEAYIDYVKKIPVRGKFPRFTRDELYERD